MKKHKIKEVLPHQKIKELALEAAEVIRSAYGFPKESLSLRPFGDPPWRERFAGTEGDMFWELNSDYTMVLTSLEQLMSFSQQLARSHGEGKPIRKMATIKQNGNVYYLPNSQSQKRRRADEIDQS